MEQREAFDLHNAGCRQNFKDALRYHWRSVQWWVLVYQDTVNRVCSREGTTHD